MFVWLHGEVRKRTAASESFHFHPPLSVLLFCYWTAKHSRCNIFYRATTQSEGEGSTNTWVFQHFATFCFLIKTQICLGSDMMRGVNKHLDTANDNFYCSVANSVINIRATKCHTLLISRRLRHNCHSFLQCKKIQLRLSCKKVIFLPNTFFKTTFLFKFSELKLSRQPETLLVQEATSSLTVKLI